MRRERAQGTTHMKVKLTVLASGQVKLFDSIHDCEKWYKPRFGRSSVRIETTSIEKPCGLCGNPLGEESFSASDGVNKAERGLKEGEK